MAGDTSKTAALGVGNGLWLRVVSFAGVAFLVGVILDNSLKRGWLKL